MKTRTPRPEGVLLPLRVQPRASRDEIVGWQNGALRVRVTAPPVDGAAKLLLETGLHPGALKDMVSSPGGTSIAGVAALEEGGIRTTFIKAVERATLRSRELGQGPT